MTVNLSALLLRDDKIDASSKTQNDVVFIFSAHVLLFSPPTCASQCKLHRLRANARLSALLYSRSCVRVAVTEWSRLALADQLRTRRGLMPRLASIAILAKCIAIRIT